MTGWAKALVGVVAVGAVAGLALLLTMDQGDQHGGAPRGSDPVVAGEDEPRAMQLPAAPSGETAPLQVVDAAPSSLAPAAQGAAATAAAAVEPTTVLTGRVVDTSNRPVVGAKVSFAAAEDMVLRRRVRAGETAARERPRTTTDRDGRFRLELPPEAEPAPEDDDEDAVRWPGMGTPVPRLVAAHEAFATLVQEAPRLHPGEVDAGTLRMQPGARLVGRVVDEQGRPLRGATVMARSEDDGVSGMPLMHLFSTTLAEEHSHATTGSDGRFAVGGLRPGKVSVTAQADQRQPGFLSGVAVDVAAPTDVGDIALPAGQTIAGYVLDDQRQPVEGARVRVSSMTRVVITDLSELPRQRFGTEMGITAETDAAGHFVLEGLGAGPFTVHASAEGFADGSLDNVSTGVTDAIVSITRLGGLLVTVRSAQDNVPVDGAGIRASARRTDGLRFIGPGETLEVLAGVAALEAAGATDLSPEGRYFVVGAGPAGTTLAVTASGYAHTESEGPGVGSGEVGRVEVLLPPESVIEGHVVDSAGQPVGGATVRLSRNEPDFVETIGPHGVEREVRRSVRLGGEGEGDEWARTKTREDGFFRLGSVPAGDWELVASAPGFARSVPLALSLDLGRSQRDVEVVLEAAGSVAGLVRTEAGAPVPGAEVIVKAVTNRPAPAADDLSSRLALALGEGSDSASTRRATADRDGRFQVEGLRPGAYDVQLSKSRGHRIGRAFVFMAAGDDAVEDVGASQRVTVAAREEAWVELVRPPFASIEGRVLAAGRPVEGVGVTLGEAESFLPFGGDVADTDAFGRFVFEDVEPGEYELSCVVPGAALAEKVPVAVEAGQKRSADIVFDGATLRGRIVDAETGVGVPDVIVNVTPVAATGSSPRPREAFAIQMVTVDGSGGGGGMQMEFGGGSQSKVRSGPEGHFEVRFLDAGRYQVQTTGGGYLGAEVGPVEVRDGEDKDDLQVEVERGARLTGSVRSGATGQVLDGVPVQLGSPDESRMTMTEGGRYSFEGLPAGEYTLSVLGSDFGSAPLAEEVVLLKKGESRTVDLTTEG